jgi:hypothetical protein
MTASPVSSATIICGGVRPPYIAPEKPRKLESVQGDST